MRRHLTIWRIMIGLVGLAASFSALHAASVLSFRLAYSVAIVVLVLATIAARYRGPFWFGFAVTGWTAFLLGNGEHYYPRIGINMDWLPARWTYYLWTWFFDQIEPGGSNAFLNQERILYSARVFSLLVTLALALLGGIAACAIARPPSPSRPKAGSEN